MGRSPTRATAGHQGDIEARGQIPASTERSDMRPFSPMLATSYLRDTEWCRRAPRLGRGRLGGLGGTRRLLGLPDASVHIGDPVHAAILFSDLTWPLRKSHYRPRAMGVRKGGAALQPADRHRPARGRR